MSEKKEEVWVYITKYALSSGIYMALAHATGTGQYIATKDANGNVAVFSGKEWCFTKKQAEADARRRRDQKIVSLQKQIDALLRLDLTAPKMRKVKNDNNK